MVGSATKPPRRPSTRGLLSARSNPAWLNQATVKGTILVLAGASMTVTTQNTDRYVPLILGALLVAWAASELWFRVVRRAAPRDLAGLAFPLALLVAGVVLIVDPGPALSEILGAALVVRAAILLVSNWNSSRIGHGWVPLVRVITVLGVGVVMIALPESLVLGVRALGGGLAVVIGGILLARGLRPDNRDEVLELDARGAGTLTRDWLRAQRLDAARIDEISAGLFYEPPSTRSSARRSTSAFGSSRRRSSRPDSRSCCLRQRAARAPPRTLCWGRRDAKRSSASIPALAACGSGKGRQSRRRSCSR